MIRPRLLDLFCGAGGCSVGYHRAGLDVVGVDIAKQPRYPFEFQQADALEVLADTEFLAGFDVIHASPPCQAYSYMSNCRPGLAAQYPDLIELTRNALQKFAGIWAIENVPNAPLRPDAVLCGQMFGLDLYRHRIFELSHPVPVLEHPNHIKPGSRAGHWKPGTVISISGNCAPMWLARQAMGIDWMRRSELTEAIPPAYTEFIGAQLLSQMRAAA